MSTEYVFNAQSYESPSFCQLRRILRFYCSFQLSFHIGCRTLGLSFVLYWLLLLTDCVAVANQIYYPFASILGTRTSSSLSEQTHGYFL